MALTNKQLRVLTGGVSEQADSLRHDTQCTAQTNFLSDPVKGLVKRPGTTTIGGIVSGINHSYAEGDKEVFTHEIIRDGDNQLLLSIANGKMSLVDLADGSKITIKNAAGSEIDYNAAQTYLAYSGTYDTHPYAATTVADHTFILNKENVVAMDVTTSHGTGQYEKPLNRYGTVFITEGAYNAEYTITAVDSDGTSRVIRVKTSDGLGAGNVVDSKTDNITAAIHGALADTIASPVVDRAFTIANYGSTADEDTGILISYTDTGGTFNQGTTGPAKLFHRTGSVITWYAVYANQATYDASTNKIDIGDSFGNTMSTTYTNVKDSFEGLPLEGPNNYHVKIQGNPESAIDDYYVQFQLYDDNATHTERGAGRWVETLNIAEQFSFDEDTMPHILVKIDATNYQFKPAEWDDKTVGDTATDPLPVFITTPINDIFFFKSRLGFLAGENVIMTELNDPFNFWRTTVTQVLSSDRIDISSSVNQITILNYAVPFANQMVVFSDRTQFIINYGSQGLDPQSAALAQIASYEASESVRPIALDANIIFAQNRTSSTAVYELFPTGTTELTFEAADITEQVPSYVTGKAIRLIGSSLAGCVLVQTDSSANELFCYKFFNRGRERILSSWFKYDFPVNDCKGMHFVGDTCYKVNEVEDRLNPGTFIHVIDTFKMDNTEVLTFSIDFLVKDTDLTVTYNGGTDETKLDFSPAGAGRWDNFPDYFDYADLIVFDDSGVTATLRVTDPQDGFIYFDGDWTAKTFFVGVKFAAEYEFSKQYLKNADQFGKERAVVDGRTTVKWVEVYLSNSQFMQIEVSYPDVNRTTTTKTFNGNVVGSVVLGDQASETGTLRSIVGARNDVPTIKLKSSTHQTAVITGASFELMFTSRLRGRN